MAEYVIYMVIYVELRRCLCPRETHGTYCLLGEKIYTIVPICLSQSCGIQEDTKTAYHNRELSVFTRGSAP